MPSRNLPFPVFEADNYVMNRLTNLTEAEQAKVMGGDLFDLLKVDAHRKVLV